MEDLEQETDTLTGSTVDTSPEPSRCQKTTKSIIKGNLIQG